MNLATDPVFVKQAAETIIREAKKYKNRLFVIEMTHGNDKAWLKRLSSHEFFILILTIKVSYKSTKRRFCI